ncbi:T9SS type A sorting domain-containing protein [Flaviaesturariibacter aridisoli]|uniref:T9SS type A sorting domain-containing protein n=1 Tax=Flaviaesturariibacter aridisoli TaxID=2545761 RepID=A0A4R4E1S8_9BACT|nr:T9SS type A sorting domain-containing protein [Flaviaesturariibacter aridisoli]TCZ73444.1 T9SS type A sorting domain-containing protein [Flaviaesturariibacter aridisoli]
MQAKNLLATILFILCLFLVATVSANNVIARTSGNWGTASTWVRTLSGTIRTVDHSTTITGTGTSFTTDLTVNSTLYAADGSVIGTIQSITSATSLKLYSGANNDNSALAYGKEAVPQAGDDVTIGNHFDVTLNQTATINKLTLQAYNSSTGTTTLIIGAFTLNITGNLAINGGSNSNRVAKVIFSGAGILNVSGDVTIGSGAGGSNSASLDLTNGGTEVGGKLRLGGAISRNTSDGSWTPGTTATVEYFASSGQNVNTALSYPKLLFTGGTKTVNSGTLTIAGDWTINSATNLSSNNPNATVTGYVTGTGTITKGTGTITTSANWTNTGTFPTGVNVTFNNSTSVAIPAQTYGTLGVVNAKTLAGDVTASTLQLGTNARLSLGGSSLTAGTLSGGSSTNYVVTNGTGVLKVTAASTQAFPVGPTSSIYSPVTVSGTNRDWSVRVQNSFSGYPSTGMSGALKLVWHITPSASATANVTFQYSESQVSFTSPAKMDVYHYGVPSPNPYNVGAGWYLATNGNDITVGGTPSARTIALTSQSQFSPFAASTNASPLPIRLLSFSGRKQTSGSLLTWATAGESMNSGFEVQRSSDGITFNVIGFVSSLAAGGNSSHTLNYSFSDNAPFRGRIYYRLRQLDIDGRAHLSQTVLLNADKGGALSIGAFYPSPVRKSAQVSVEVAEAGDLTLRIVSMSGAQMRSWKAAAGAGTNTLAVAADDLPAGTYFLQVLDAQGNSSSSRFVKQ